MFHVYYQTTLPQAHHFSESHNNLSSTFYTIHEFEASCDRKYWCKNHRMAKIIAILTGVISRLIMTSLLMKEHWTVGSPQLESWGKSISKNLKLSIINKRIKNEKWLLNLTFCNNQIDHNAMNVIHQAAKAQKCRLTENNEQYRRESLFSIWINCLLLYHGASSLRMLGIVVRFWNGDIYVF